MRPCLHNSGHVDGLGLVENIGKTRPAVEDACPQAQHPSIPGQACGSAAYNLVPGQVQNACHAQVMHGLVSHRSYKNHNRKCCVVGRKDIVHQ